MIFLINCSNLKVGGGLQVADSICKQLNQYTSHRFVVVLSSMLGSTGEGIKHYSNVVVYTYNIKNNMPTLLLGRDWFLDSLVKNHSINAVLTIFGPSRWQPRCPHLSGFARAHLVLSDSPYLRNLKLREKLKYRIWMFYFKKSSDIFYTENPYISKRLSALFGEEKTIYTITNYYHQVYDNPNSWKKNIIFPQFEGITMLTVTGNYEHKNIPIMVPICDYFIKNYPNFKFRFALTLSREQCDFIPVYLDNYFMFLGKVDIEECPNLYKQADIMFMPSLLECFSATYPEAMRMQIPIVTTDLTFARGLCGRAACYYDACSPIAAAEAIYNVANDKKYRGQLVQYGNDQLKEYDDYNARPAKLIKILEEIAKKSEC